MRVAAAFLVAATGLSLLGPAGSAATSAKVTVTPTLVRTGGTISIVGGGFKSGLKVTLYIGRPSTDNVARFGTRYAGRKGGFRLTKRIPGSSGVGSGPSWPASGSAASRQRDSSGSSRSSPSSY